MKLKGSVNVIARQCYHNTVHYIHVNLSCYGYGYG
jgi:hypothetical protein